MQKKRIIFDLDGTIIPTIDFKESVIHALKKFSISYTEEQLEYYMLSMKNYENFYRKYTINDYFEFVKMQSGINITMEYMKYFLEHAEYLVPERVEEGVVVTLEYLKGKYDLVILTNFFEKTQINRLRALKIDNYFSKVFGGEIFLKPDELAFIYATSKYKKDECLVIGDNIELDINGAKNAGIDTIYYNRQGKHNDNLEINDFSYLRKIL